MDHKLNMMFIHDCYFFFFTASPGMWDLTSVTRRESYTPCNGSTVLTWTARKVPTVGFKRKAVNIKVYIWNL